MALPTAGRHLQRFTHLSSLRRIIKYGSLLKISRAPVNGILQGATCIWLFFGNLQILCLFHKGRRGL